MALLGPFAVLGLALALKALRRFIKPEVLKDTTGPPDASHGTPGPLEPDLKLDPHAVASAEVVEEPPAPLRPYVPPPPDTERQRELNLQKLMQAAVDGDRAAVEALAGPAVAGAAAYGILPLGNGGPLAPEGHPMDRGPDSACERDYGPGHGPHGVKVGEVPTAAELDRLTRGTPDLKKLADAAFEEALAEIRAYAEAQARGPLLTAERLANFRLEAERWQNTTVEQVTERFVAAVVREAEAEARRLYASPQAREDGRGGFGWVDRWVAGGCRPAYAALSATMLGLNNRQDSRDRKAATDDDFK
jgi:hypothetical protein